MPNTNGDGWFTTTTACWWKLDFGSAVAVAAYAISNRPDAAANQRDPAAWTLEGSNDDSAWDVLDTRSGVTWSAPGETQNFTSP